MSINTKRSIKCPQCSHFEEMTVWNSITADDSPDLKQDLLSGKINVFVCGNCSAKALVPEPLLYSDHAKKLMISFMPTDNDEEKLRRYENIKKTSKASGELDELEDYDLRFVSVYDDLLEKILIFDNGLHDKVIEVIKLLILMQEPEKAERRSALFGKKEDRELEFLVKDAEENMLYTSRVPLDTYETVKEQLRQSGVKYKSFDWEIVDKNYAAALLRGANNNL